MWLRRARFLTSPSAIGISLAVSLLTFAQATNALCENKQEEVEHINVYLKEDSINMVNQFLKIRGYSNHKAEYVCLHSHANSTTSHIFHPIYGQRVAFRIKGIIDLPDGNAVAIGKLSNMIGELKADDFEVSMPIVNSASEGLNIRLLLDLPTRIKKIVDLSSKHHWRGRVPAGPVGNQNYEALRVTFTTVPFLKQPVVDGYLCGSRHVDENKQCTFEFDTSTIRTEEKDSSVTSTDGDIVSHELKEKNYEHQKVPSLESESEIKPECPMCKYMKAGPCKDEFIEWDKCLGNLKPEQELIECFEPTKTMMKCMQQYEYYDIMTAGTDYGRMEAASVPQKEEASIPRKESETSE